MKTITINCIKDAENFLQFLYDEYDLAFHPDDPFDQYIDRTGNRLFTDEQASYLDMVMKKCFEVCEQNGTDIYEVMDPIQSAEFRRRGIIS
jgi:hypothetical protein